MVLLTVVAVSTADCTSGSVISLVLGGHNAVLCVVDRTAGHCEGQRPGNEYRTYPPAVSASQGMNCRSLLALMRYGMAALVGISKKPGAGPERSASLTCREDSRHTGHAFVLPMTPETFAVRNEKDFVLYAIGNF